MRAGTLCLATFSVLRYGMGEGAVATVWSSTIRAVDGNVHEIGARQVSDKDQQETNRGIKPSLSSAQPREKRLNFVSSNEYVPVTSPWEHTAEPFRDTTFTADSTIGNPGRDVFKWSFEDGTVLEGREVKHTFKALGKHTVELSQIVTSSGEVYRMEGSVMVKYVRREIRSLTEVDREAFFDAMETLYRLPTTEGNRLYGDDYKGIEFFVQMHLDGAGMEECDHWHDDAGIMTHHVGYTLQFEQSLQLVNPAVSIPYWEYTIEAARGKDDYGSSEIFGGDWFGEACPDNDLHTVDKGRWAYLPVMKDAWNYVHNSYGLLRTPWNSDPTPYVTRHNRTNAQNIQGVVSCNDYQLCFNADSLADMNNCLNGGTHGPVHIKIGGEWDDPEEAIIQSLSYSNQVPILSKVLWRKGYLRVPTACSTEETGLDRSSTCRTSCPAELYESRGMSQYDVLMDVHALYWIAQSSGGVIRWDEEEGRFTVAGHEEDTEFQNMMWAKVLQSLCDPGHVGELFTSSAPYDPLFWVIHPAADRFLAWRRKLATEHPEEYFFDESWGYSHGKVVGETGEVCDWSGVRDDSLDMPTCVKGLCGGHGAEDMLPFEVKINGRVQKMTNTQWLDFIYPDNEELPYMYDSFEWSHCTELGYPLGSVSP